MFFYNRILVLGGKTYFKKCAIEQGDEFVIL